MRVVVGIGLALSAAVVLLGLLCAAFLAVTGGWDWGLFGLIISAFVGVMALAVIWLGVFVVYVIVMGVRVLGDERR